MTLAYNVLYLSRKHGLCSEQPSAVFKVHTALGFLDAATCSLFLVQKCAKIRNLCTSKSAKIILDSLHVF